MGWARKRWKALRREKWEKHPFCAYCGRRLKLRHTTLDHVVPKARGGTYNPGNALLSCLTCNRKKGAMTIREFLDAVEAGEIRLEREAPLEVPPNQ